MTEQFEPGAETAVRPVKFNILGPLEISRGGEQVHIGGPRLQTILAMLLLEADHVLPIDRLIMAVWDEKPPPTAREQVQICISALRRQVLRDDGQQLIVSRRPGYLLTLNGADLDYNLFEARIMAATDAVRENAPLRARAEFRSALNLWRGHALDGISSRLVQQSVAKLNERRLIAVEKCIDCELRLGMHQELVGELVDLVGEYPLRERLRALLMTALYGSGRQAEALDFYLHTRNDLIEELGIEPGKELQELQQAILSGNPLPGVQGITTGHLPSQTVITRDPVQVPRLLPASIPDFTGRSEIEHSLLTELSERGNAEEGHQAVRVNIIVGQGGAGKTTLAVNLAHKLAPHFPDGQLFARLRTGEHHVNPADILERFLRALGVTSSILPVGIEDRAGMYRNLLGKRRILIVLDDAVAEQQIAALLPGNSQCSVIVTSRKRLTGIAATRRVEISGFTHSSAVEFLSRAVGPDRIQAEPDAVSALCTLCEYLPLALRIVAARLADRPHWSVSDLVDRLQDDSRKLDELSYGGAEMRASISLTYQSLSPDARRLFRTLAVSDAPSFASWVGSPLLQTDVAQAQDLLEELTEAHLIVAESDPATGRTRYRFDDIMRAFANERLTAEESAQDRQKSLEYLLGTLLYLADQAHGKEYSRDSFRLRSEASRWPLPDAMVDRLMEDPLAWYESERPTLVSAVLQAARSGLVEHSWDLALNGVTGFESHARYDDWRETHDAALKVACRSGDRRGEAAMRYSLGSLYTFERHDTAARQLEQALTLYRQLGDRYGIALVLCNIAFLNRVDGDLELALSRWEEALAAFQIHGDRIAEAHALHNMAKVQLDLGDDAAALELLDQAERICMNLSNRRVEAQVRHRRGELHIMCGELELAADAFRRVLVACREVGDQNGECYALLGLGTVQLKRGELREAAETLADAQYLAARRGEPMVRNRIALAQADVALKSDADMLKGKATGWRANHMSWG